MPQHPSIPDLLVLAPVIPVLTIDDPDAAVPLGRALVAGGLPVLEITLRTPVAVEAIARIAAAGARFGVSPGATPALLAAAEEAGLPFLPGAITPSEVIALLDAGYRHLKFFPAEPAGGIPMLKAFSAPLPEARFCPTGGIDLAKAPAYLALPNVLCIGGSWVAPADAVARGDWARIETLAREAGALKGR